MRAALRALLGHWRRHPVQLLTLVVGLALATGLWTGVQAINAQARQSYADAAATLDRDTLPRLEGVLTLDDFAAARRAGWPVTPVVDAALPGTGLRVLGLDPFTAPPGPASAAVGEAEVLTGFLLGAVVLVEPGTAARVPDGIAARAVEGLAPGVVVADVARALDLAGTDRLDGLLLTSDGVGSVPLDSLFPDARLVAPSGDAGIGRLTDSFHLNLTAFGLLAFAVGLFIVHAAIGLAFEQRRALFRTLRALGVPLGVLMGCLSLELVALTLLGGGLGVALGYVVAAALLPGVAATLSGLYGAGVSGSLSLSPAWWLSGLGMAALGLVVAGGQSLWSLARLPLLAPAQPRAWAMARTATLRRQAVAGAGLLVAAGVLAVVGDGLPAGFALLGALLLGAAFLLPAVVTAVLAGGARLARRPVAEWMWADARQQVPGLSLALMALMLALAANIGVGTMVGSFRGTFTGWLDQRLASEIYVTAADVAEAEAMQALLADDARVTAILPIASVEDRPGGAAGQVYAIADHATYRDNWPLLDGAPDVWDRIAAGEAALVNEQLARREGLWTGATVDLGRGGTWPVAGVYSDYGNPLGQAMLGLEVFRATYADAPITQFALRVVPGGTEGVIADLTAAFDLPGQRIVDQASIKEFSLAVFERTFAVTTALNVLTLGVAAFALWASLTTLAEMRLPQIAPLWALGLTRRRIALADLGRALGLAALTALLAVPVGVALAWALLAVVNVLAFGWRLPLRVFPGEWALLGLWAMLAAGLAAALPTARLWRMPPARLVKVFAHER
ncbi:FtsX-like permease family protein [Jannaschia sp. LMIT008]|uniref:FtsX-like permease family protein n=1 Tax=Jannaschia maritima TaxID=3032585 RepID=UPI002811E383|nr:FtsX-like permease family protein [Jannaschia sp. LMIT008]